MGSKKCFKSALGVLTVTAIAVGANVSRDGNQKIGNHADRKDSVVVSADKNNQANHNGEGAECTNEGFGKHGGIPFFGI
jgi:hypothetical protein